MRYGSLYGERADDHNSIYKIIKQALSEAKITYHGTGNEIREFIHVQDAAQGSVQILEPEFENQHIIFAGTQTMRYKDLLEMVREILGNKISIEIVPSERDAHYKSHLIISAQSSGKNWRLIRISIWARDCCCACPSFMEKSTEKTSKNNLYVQPTEQAHFRDIKA